MNRRESYKHTLSRGIAWSYTLLEIKLKICDRCISKPRQTCDSFEYVGIIEKTNIEF